MIITALVAELCNMSSSWSRFKITTAMVIVLVCVDW